MTQTCETCGRSWGDRAMFCGACGALLDQPLPSRGGRHDDRPTWWRRPAVGGGLAVIALVGIVAAVPTLSIQRTDPIEDTSIDVPDVDDLQAAPADIRPRPAVEPPEFSCTREGVEVDCVTWSRGLVEPMGTTANGRQTWPMVFGGHLLLIGASELEAIDATTGTRLWRRTGMPDLHPVGGSEDLLVLGGSDAGVLDLDTGETRWSIPTFGRNIYGDVAHEDVVYTVPESDATERGVAARDPQDGAVRWTWPTEWTDVHVQRLEGERLLVASAGEGMAVLDAATGVELSSTAGLSEGWIIDVVDDTVVTVLHPDVDPSEPNRAGDPGAVVTGHDIGDGTVKWQRDVRSSEVQPTSVAGMMVAASSRHLTAFDVATGEVLWEVETATSERVARPRFVGTWPAGTGDDPDPELVVTTDDGDGTLRGRDVTTGEAVWERDLQARPWHAMELGDVTVVQTNSGIDVVATATGQERLHVDGPDLQLAGIDPLIVFHPVSGYVTRVDLSSSPDR